MSKIAAIKIKIRTSEVNDITKNLLESIARFPNESAPFLYHSLHSIFNPQIGMTSALCQKTLGHRVQKERVR